MIRCYALGCALALLLIPAVCLGQTMESAEGDFRLPPFAAQSASGEAVVDLADFVAEYLSETGAVPDMAQVKTADGNATTLSAAEVFALLARTAHLWRFTGGLPETVPLPSDEISPPVLDAEDVVVPVQDQELGRDVPTESFLSTVPAVVRWVDRLQVVPTAVYVEGERLSAADYLAGLAICVSYAYWEGQLYETVFLPPYGPPQAWTGEEEAYDYASAYEEEAWEGTGSDEEGYWEEESAYEPFAGDEMQPLTGAWPEPFAETQSEPELVVYPEPGERISGYVDLVASYAGPPERFVIFTLDASREVIRNFPPYSYRWDTRRLEPGIHTVRVQVLGAGDDVLADQTTAYFVEAAASEGETDIPSDL